jgi:hypothetical protein
MAAGHAGFALVRQDGALYKPELDVCLRDCAVPLVKRFLHVSPTLAPNSTSFKMPTIWLSLNFDFFT